MLAADKVTVYSIATSLDVASKALVRIADVLEKMGHAEIEHAILEVSRSLDHLAEVTGS